MSTLRSGGSINSAAGQAAIAIFAAVAACASWAFSTHPAAPLGLGVLLLGLIIAIQEPFLTGIAFVLFSVFRLHEVLPALAPLHLPLALGSLTLLSLSWHIFVARSFEIRFPPEIRAMVVFFAIVSFGIAFAKSKPPALDAWPDFLKVVTMALALSWAASHPKHLLLASRAIVLCGILVGAVAIYNKINGIGLVENSRVTIGRDIHSALGDPNDLALTLLLPLSFAASLAVIRTTLTDLLLGVAGVITVTSGIICTQSRGGLIGVVTVFAVLGWRTMKSRTLLVLVAVVISAGLYSAMGISERASGGAADTQDESAQARLYAWGAATNMALDRPLTGVGFSNFPGQLFYYSPPSFKQILTAHSTWFLVLGETGILGAIAFLTMMALTLRSAMDSARRLRSAEAPAGLRSFALGLVTGLFGFCASATFLSEAYFWFVYMMLAFTAVLRRLVAEFNISDSVSILKVANPSVRLLTGFRNGIAHAPSHKA